MPEFHGLLDRPDFVARLGAFGAGLGGVVGGIVGLVAGLLVYAPTAWFAVFELGVPAAVVGGLGGLATGVVIKTGHRRLGSNGV
jgi:hypothetical protein